MANFFILLITYVYFYIHRLCASFCQLDSTCMPNRKDDSVSVSTADCLVAGFHSSECGNTQASGS